MLALADRQWEVLRERHGALFTAFLEASCDVESTRRYIEASTLSYRISDVCFALDAEHITRYWDRKSAIKGNPHSERRRHPEGTAFQV
jgi:hypothetical protein